MNGILIAAALMGLVPPIPKPVGPERLQELIKMLEVPMRSNKDGSTEPFKGVPPTRHFRFHDEAIKELAQAGPAAIGPLISLYEDRTKHTQARTQAAWLLAGYAVGMLATPEPRVIDAVQKAIRDKDPAVREETLYRLSYAGNSQYRRRRGRPSGDRGLSPAVVKAILPDVLASVSDEDPDVATRAMWALDAFGKGVGIGELLGALKRKEIAVRIAAVEMLGDLGPGDARVLPALELLVTQNDLRLAMALFGTSPLQTAVATTPLHDCVSKESQVSLAAAEAIGQFGPAAGRSVPQLRQRLSNVFDLPYAQFSGYQQMHVVIALGEIGPGAKAALPEIMRYFRLVRDGKSPDGNIPDVLEAIERIDPPTGREVRLICEQERMKAEQLWAEEQDRRRQKDELDRQMREAIKAEILQRLMMQEMQRRLEKERKKREEEQRKQKG